MTAYHEAMRWMRWALLLVALGVFSTLPSAASAAVLAPPGHAGANQYFETIPTSSGQAAPPGSVRGSGSSSAGSRTLAGLGSGQATDSKLAKLGKRGKAAAALAASTAPALATGAGAAAARASGGAGGSIGSGLSHALTSSSAGGLGIALPLLVATGFLAAVGLVVTRLVRRGGSSPSSV